VQAARHAMQSVVASASRHARSHGRFRRIFKPMFRIV